MADELTLKPGWLRRDGEAAKAALAPERAAVAVRDYLTSIGIDFRHAALLAGKIAPYANAPLDGIRIMFSGRVTTVLDERYQPCRVLCQIER